MNSVRNQLKSVNKSMSIQQSSQSSKSSVSHLRALVSLSVCQSVLKVLCFKKAANLSDGPVQAGALGLDFYLTCQSSFILHDLNNFAHDPRTPWSSIIHYEHNISHLKVAFLNQPLLAFLKLREILPNPSLPK